MAGLPKSYDIFVRFGFFLGKTPKDHRRLDHGFSAKGEDAIRRLISYSLDGLSSFGNSEEQVTAFPDEVGTDIV